ncbi:hypothetical protein PMAYCL1PPCAC_24708, partial [Pristionchus mayeri]
VVRIEECGFDYCSFPVSSLTSSPWQFFILAQTISLLMHQIALLEKQALNASVLKIRPWLAMYSLSPPLIQWKSVSTTVSKIARSARLYCIIPTTLPIIASSTMRIDTLLPRASLILQIMLSTSRSLFERRNATSDEYS